MTRLSKRCVSIVYSIISPPERSCRFPKIATSSWQLLLSDHWGPLCVTSPKSPQCLLFWRLRQKLWWCISCRAWLCPLSSCLGYKTHSSIEYVTRKQMDSLTFKAKSTPRWWTVDLVVQHRPGTLALSFVKIVPTICVEKGILFQWHYKVYSTAHNKPPTLILQAVAIKALSNRGRRLKTRPLDSC